MAPNALHPQVIIHGSLAQNLANRESSYKSRMAFPAYQNNAHQPHHHTPTHHNPPHHHSQQLTPHNQPSPAMRDRTRSGGQTPRDMVWVDSKERLSEMATDIRGISSALSNVALAVPVSRIMILSKLSDYDIEEKVREVTKWLLNWTCDNDAPPMPTSYGGSVSSVPGPSNGNAHTRSPLAISKESNSSTATNPQPAQHSESNEPNKWYTGSESDDKKAPITQPPTPDDIFSTSPPQSAPLSTNSSASSSYMSLEVARVNDIDSKNAQKTQSKISHCKVPTKSTQFEPQAEKRSREYAVEPCTTGNLVVYVQDLLVNRGVIRGEEFDSWRSQGRLKVWQNTNVVEQVENIDLIITLGGDGTVLYNSWLFQKMVPPTLSFALGSLGFMTENDFVDYPSVLDHSLVHGICCTLRMRFQCEVMRTKNPEKEGSDDLREEIWQGGQNSHFTTHTVDGKYTILNEAVVDRGPNPFVTMTELYGDYDLLTTIKADGVVISTPTGSTAYSMSAGGSLVHPDIPARLISPICPHTLSFRPLVVPDSMALHIGVPYDARSSAFVSFDGKKRVELRRGDFMAINVSRYPFPKVLPPNSTNVTWVQQLSRTLHWNEQKRPKRYTDGTTDNWMQD